MSFNYTFNNSPVMAGDHVRIRLKSGISGTGVVAGVSREDGYICFIWDDNNAETNINFDMIFVIQKIGEPVTDQTNRVDMVSHPPHYQSETGMEVIDVIEAFTFDLKGIEATDTGNILKYICRWKGKNGLQDLKKAMWYLTHLINHVEKLEKEND